MKDKEQKDFIKKKFKEGLLDAKNQNESEIISKGQAQKESEGDIVSKSEDYSILPKEDEK